MLQIEDLSFRYRRKAPAVIDNMNLSIEPGGIYGLLGPNGMGKSTLLYLIAGLLTAQRGQVLFDGQNTRNRHPGTLSDIFIVPEEFTLPGVTLRDYVKANARFYGRFSMDDLRRHLATFDLTEDLHLSQLSMGQKKRVFLSFALACNTRLLLMDEPTNGLDIPGKSQFRKFIISGMNDDKSILISTHQVRDVDRILDHIVLLHSSGVLLNRSMGEISEKLLFSDAVDQETLARALYVHPSPTGADIILPRQPGEEASEVNLESLFEWAYQHPGQVNEIFNS